MYLNDYTQRKCGIQTEEQNPNLFRDRSSVAVAPLLDGISEEHGKLYGVLFSSVQLRMFT